RARAWSRARAPRSCRPHARSGALVSLRTRHLLERWGAHVGPQAPYHSGRIARWLAPARATRAFRRLVGRGGTARVWREADSCRERSAACGRAASAPRDAVLAHLAVEIRAIDAEPGRGLRHVPVRALERAPNRVRLAPLD